MKCSYDENRGTTECVDIVRDPDQLGEGCEVDPREGTDTCDAHLYCAGTCLPVCDFDADPECPAGYQCSTCQDCVPSLCIPDCEPLLQECPEGQVCVPDGNAFTCVLDASGDAGAFGDPCEYVNACDPGLACLEPESVPECEGTGCCSPFCDLTDPQCPDEALECTPWFGEGDAPPPHENVGACVLPQP